jgi:hypothetical protein
MPVCAVRETYEQSNRGLGTAWYLEGGGLVLVLVLAAGNGNGGLWAWARCAQLQLGVLEVAWRLGWAQRWAPCWYCDAVSVTCRRRKAETASRRQAPGPGNPPYLNGLEVILPVPCALGEPL